MERKILGKEALRALDALEMARMRAKSAEVLAIALETYPNAIEDAETAAMSQLCIAATDALEAALERVEAALTRGNQSTDYWRGYEDGRVAAAASQQQKAITVKGA